VFFGYPLLEVATAYLVAQLLGWGWMLLLLVVGIPVGFALMRNAGDAAMRDMATATGTGQSVDSSRHALSFVGGLLIAIPGFWTDLVGLLLVLPLTQRLFRKRLRTWFAERLTVVHMPGVRYPGGDVVQGTVIQRDDTPAPPTGPPPALT
jgi:UPF0716 protein FxsA